MNEKQRPTLDYGDLANYLKCTGTLAYLLQQAIFDGRCVSKDASEAVYALNLLIEHIAEEAERADTAELAKKIPVQPDLIGDIPPLCDR